MTTLFLILASCAIYFAVVSRVGKVLDAESEGQLLIEVERDEDGYHAAVLDLGEDAVLHVTDSVPTGETAIDAARAWIAKNG